MAAVQGTSKSGGSCPEYVSALLQFVVLSTLSGTCYSLRGHSVHTHTQYMLTYTDIHTHAVHIQLILMDAISCRELKAIRMQLQDILGPSAIHMRGVRGDGVTVEGEEGGADISSLVSIIYVMAYLWRRTVPCRAAYRSQMDFGACQRVCTIARGLFGACWQVSTS